MSGEIKVADQDDDARDIGQFIEQLGELLAEALQRRVARLVGRTEQLGQLILASAG